MSLRLVRGCVLETEPGVPVHITTPSGGRVRVQVLSECCQA